MQGLLRDGLKPNIGHTCHSWSYAETKSPSLPYDVLHLSSARRRILRDSTIGANHMYRARTGTQWWIGLLPAQGIDTKRVQKSMSPLSLDCTSD